MTKTTTPTTSRGVAFNREPRPFTCIPLLFILEQPENCSVPHKEQPKGFGLFPARHLKPPLSLYLFAEIMSSLPRGMMWRMNPPDERVQCGDRWKKRRECFVVAAKQKAHSNRDPSLLWYGGQACWSSVCFCAPVQTSSNLAIGREGGTVGRVCLFIMEAGGQIALTGGKEVREGGRAGWRDATADEVTQPCSVASHLFCRRGKGMWEWRVEIVQII